MGPGWETITGKKIEGLPALPPAPPAIFTGAGRAGMGGWESGNGVPLVGREWGP